MQSRKLQETILWNGKLLLEPKLTYSQVSSIFFKANKIKKILIFLDIKDTSVVRVCKFSSRDKFLGALHKKNCHSKLSIFKLL